MKRESLVKSQTERSNRKVFSFDLKELRVADRPAFCSRYMWCIKMSAAASPCLAPTLASQADPSQSILRSLGGS